MNIGTKLIIGVALGTTLGVTGFVIIGMTAGWLPALGIFLLLTGEEINKRAAHTASSSLSLCTCRLAPRSHDPRPPPYRAPRVGPSPACVATSYGACPSLSLAPHAAALDQGSRHGRDGHRACGDRASPHVSEQRAQRGRRQPPRSRAAAPRDVPRPARAAAAPRTDSIARTPHGRRTASVAGPQQAGVVRLTIAVRIHQSAQHQSTTARPRMECPPASQG